MWVAAHGSQYDLKKTYRPDAPYDPFSFVDAEGFLAAVTKLEAAYRAQLAAEGL